MALIATPLAAALLAACGSTPSQPAHSAPAACHDFQNWFLAQGANVLAGKDKTLLTRAVSQAPSGTLYRDLSTFKSDVSTATAAQGTSLAIGEKGLTIEAAQAVETDCQSVNPG